MAIDPRTMSRTELMRWLKTFLAANNRRSVIELIDQWDLQDKIQDITIFDNVLKDTSKVQLKSTKTRFMKVYYEEIYQMFDENKIDALDVGYIILLGKYVDFEDNTLKNEDGTYITTQEIMRILKISDSTVKRFIKRMLNNQIIFKQLDETDKYKRKNKYFINPHILYKGKYIDKKIKKRLDEIRKQVKEIKKTNKKNKTGDNVVISLLDKLQELDYSDMSEEEIDSMQEELHSLVV